MPNMRIRTILTILVPTLFCASIAVAEQHQRFTLIAGNGRDSGDKSAYPEGLPTGKATEIAIGTPFGVEPHEQMLYLTTVSDHCVWRLDSTNGELVRVAGNGTRGYSGDGGPATDAAMDWPHEVRVDTDGNLFIADTRNHVIRKVDAKTKSISTIAGSGVAGDSGDGGPAIAAKLNQPHSVVLDGNGGVLIADTVNHRIRRVDLATGIINTIAGTGEKKLPSDKQTALGAPLFGPRSLAVDEHSIWIALREGNSVWRLDRKKGTLHHIAGSGKKGFSDDGEAAATSTFNGPKGLAIDADGNVLVADTENHAIRRIDLNANTVTTVMGGHIEQATTRLARPHGITIDKDGKAIVGDSENHRVIRF